MLKERRFEWEPGTAEIAGVFREETEAAGGRVLDLLVDGDQFFARAVVPSIAGEVSPRDEVQGGVALRTKGPHVLIHPFVYRLVCKNGAIRAHATETRRVTRRGEGDFLPSDETVLTDVREALRAASGIAAFRDGLDEMRSASRMDADIAEADMILSMLSILGNAGSSPRSAPSSLVRTLLEHFERTDGGGPGRPGATLFDLMNAVTATARDTRDPEQRWNLEALGGAVGARLIRPRPRRESGATLTLA